MNERIRELAEQAGIPAIDGEWDYNNRTLLVKDNNEWRPAVPSEIISTMIQSERGLEKFAQLIVQECADVGSKFSLAHPEAIRGQIKRHFGVE